LALRKIENSSILNTEALPVKGAYFVSKRSHLKRKQRVKIVKLQG
jgi:hypothetical protein